MKYIGNFAHQMDRGYIEKIMSLDPSLNIGTKPNQESVRQILSGSTESDKSMTQWYNNGIDITRLGWYDCPVPQDKVPLDFPGKYVAWFAILPPGTMIPTHLDPVMKKDPEYWESKGVMIKRFWIACCDWVPWHFFYNKTDVLTGYRFGDVYEFDGPSDLHGSANVGFTTKMTMQLTVLYTQQDLDSAPEKWEIFRSDPSQ